MDGYAVRAADTEPAGRPLRVVGEVPAGGSHPRPLGPGEAVRIFTGGPLPDGADAVAIQENASVDGGEVRFTGSVAPGTFVRPAGSTSPGDGSACGRDAARRQGARARGGDGPRLAPRPPPAQGRRLSTGDEICRPGEPPGPSQIVSSNSTTLCAALRAWGCVAVDLGIAADRADALAERLAAAAGLDLLLTSGGASVGDYDVVGQALGGGGHQLDFWKIAMRPGKPLLFGRTGSGVRVLGLPGNPVSASVCALVFARGAIRRCSASTQCCRSKQRCWPRPWPRTTGARITSGPATSGAPPRSPPRRGGGAAGQLHVRHLRRRRRPGRPPAARPARAEGDEVEVVDLRQAFLPFA
jgi:molybdopterin molybdotransferase